MADTAHRHGAPAGHSGHGHAHHHEHGARTTPVAETLDVVCGMTVDPLTTPHRHVHRGDTYYFCSGGCRTKFVAAPEKYLDPSKREPAAPVPEGTVYTCPMHPEVRQ